MGVGSLLLENRDCVGQTSPGSRRVSPPLRPLEFAIRTTAAALLALACADLLNIHHPWWAAMTVWLVAQPTRGLLIVRSFARLFGTICGAMAGAVILTFWGRDLVVALVILAFWVALCAGLGSVFRHFRNYGLVLAGYTAGIVVLFGLGDGDATAALALDRVLCTLIGLGCSTLLSFRALPLPDVKMEKQARDILDRVLNLAENTLSRAEPTADDLLIGDIGVFDRAIDQRAAGSLSRRLDALRLRHISGLLLELIALSSRTPSGSPQTVAAGGSAQAESQLEPLQRVQHLAQQAEAGGHTAMMQTLRELSEALDPASWQTRHKLRFDFDCAVACQAIARPVLALAIAALFWQLTAWQAGAMMVMTAVLFTSLFSSHEQGNDMVIQVLLGTLAGALAGLLVRLFVLPHADGLLLMLLSIAPVLLVAAWLMRQPVTAKMAIDLAMTFLLTAQPGSAPVAAAVALSQISAIVAGVLIAVALFWLVLPSTPAVRRKHLARRIVLLTLRIAHSTRAKTARHAHEALRGTQVRLLDFTDADSVLVGAAQACLASAAETLAMAGEAQSKKSSAAQAEAAVEASAMLTAIINSNFRIKRHD
ncbi:FUSC family protein [Rhizobium sp.]|uniref:FUSC family protein n=1 Tax=Rhizobium sp. TaxID=391 RepID=UPI002AA79ABF